MKVNVDRLKTRDERTDDVTINFFKVYQVASDGEFLRYIKTKRVQYDAGYNIIEDELMTSSLNKYEILCKDNKWKSMSPEQEQIIALASVVKKLKYDNLKLANNFKSAPPGKGKGTRKGKGEIHKKTGNKYH